MQRVLVVDAEGKALMPCHPARARELLGEGKACMWRRYPFTIRLKERVGGATQPVEVKIDPGSKTTGLALVAQFKRGYVLIWAGELKHRGAVIHEGLQSRAGVRRNRRARKVRYRAARFSNRRRGKGWLPPSLLSRIDNVLTWLSRLSRVCPVSGIALELVKFDLQLMENPAINGVEYQQGVLAGYEVREYLREKWGHKCAYCGKTDVPLQIEHIVPRSRGGSNRISNLALACERCNRKKGNRTAQEYGFPGIQKQARLPLRDAAAVNATRYALLERLQARGLPVSCATGGRTKFNRTREGYPKTHWLDAACIGETGAKVEVNRDLIPLYILSTGRQSRQMCRMDRYGFPRTSAKQARYRHGFQTGDMVQAVIPPRSSTKMHGLVEGRVAVRASGFFRVGRVEGVKARYCQIVHRADGYEYQKGAKAHSSAA